MAVNDALANEMDCGPTSRAELRHRLTSEFLGTGLLLATIVGSGIMGARLADGNVAIALLANTVATGAGLVALILTFGGVSAHFNPAVSLLEAARGALPWSEVALYVLVQVAGAFGGTAVAHVMFGEPILSASTHVRSSGGELVGEFVATCGLLTVIVGCSRNRPAAVPFAVGAYITAAYWFTSSTSFANPAVTMARAATGTFSGIRPADVAGFVAAQLAGGASAALLLRWLFPVRTASQEASGVVTTERSAA
jgi:glycerol uptake facilitator-like aquaporin